MSSTMVTPPASAAAVPEAMSSFSVPPGSRRWTCTSIRPTVGSNNNMNIRIFQTWRGNNINSIDEWYTAKDRSLTPLSIFVQNINSTVEPVLCDLCHERPLVLKDGFHRHELFLIDICTTCYERPPAVRNRFCWAEGVVSQDRFYCIDEWNTGKD